MSSGTASRSSPESMITRRQFLKAGAAAGTGCHLGLRTAGAQEGEADLILTNGRFATLHRAKPTAAAVAIKDGRFVVVGSNEEVASIAREAKDRLARAHRHSWPKRLTHPPHPRRAELQHGTALGRRAITRGRAADAARAGGSNACAAMGARSRRLVGVSIFRATDADARRDQRAAPDTPVFILHLYCRALLNRAALRACGYTKDTPEPPGGEIQRDKSGNLQEC